MSVKNGKSKEKSEESLSFIQSYFKEAEEKRILTKETLELFIKTEWLEEILLVSLNNSESDKNIRQKYLSAKKRFNELKVLMESNLKDKRGVIKKILSAETNRLKKLDELLKNKQKDNQEIIEGMINDKILNIEQQILKEDLFINIEWLREMLFFLKKDKVVLEAIIKEKILNIKQKIIEGNLFLAVRWAQNHKNLFLNQSFFNLLQDANFGLVNAVYKFDILKGYYLSTYAARCMKREIISGFNNQNFVIKTPCKGFDLRKVNYIEFQFYAQFGRFPKAEEVAERAEISVQEVKYIKEKEIKLMFLDIVPFLKGKKLVLFYNGIENRNFIVNLTFFLDNKTPEIIFGEIELMQEFEIFLSNILSAKEKRITELFYRDDKSLEDIGKEFKLSRERIRQIGNEVLYKLRVSKLLETLKKIFPEITEEQIKKAKELRKEEKKIKFKKR